MALPANWTQVKVYGTYLRLDGTPNAGQIWFDSSSAVNVQDVNGDTVLVVPKRITADIDTNGYFEVMLPATSDPDLDPKGWTYSVKERITGGLEYSIDVPYDLISLNLVPMRPKAPADPSAGTINYLTTEDLGNTVGRQGDINTLNSQVATALADATNAVNTANATATTANQAADTANAASAIANSLGDQITAANTTASQAEADAQSALSQITSATNTANQALTTANGLQTQVDTASTNASNALSTANTAQTTANNAQTAADGALSTANGLNDQITAANTTANNAAAGLSAFESDLANQADTAKGTALIGHNGQTLRAKLNDMDTAIAAGGGGGGSGTFTPPGSGSVVRSIQNKLLDLPVSVLDYHQSGDGSNYSPALTRALAYSKSVFFPRGTYTLATAVNMVEGMSIVGDPASYGGTGGTTLNCTGGFLLNPNKGGGASARKHIWIENLTINGNASGKVGIDGEHGGYVKGCNFDGWGDAINNPASFFMRYEECQFNHCTGTAINLSDFNSSVVLRCQFGATCYKHIDTSTLPATDGGSRGFPYLIQGCGFNVNSANMGSASCTFEGTFQVENCYWEDFSSSATNMVHVEIVVSKFSKGNASVRYCEFNTNGKCKHAVLVRASTVPTNRYGGVISNNRFLGISNAVHFGDVNATTNSQIEGFRVFDNGDEAYNVDGGAAYRPIGMSQGVGMTAVNIAGATGVLLPIGTGSTIVTDNRGGFSGTNTYTVRKDGMYRITATATLASNETTILNDINVGLFKNNVQFEGAHMQLSPPGTGTAKAQVVLDVTLPLANTDAITMKGWNGDTVTYVSFAIQWLCDQRGWA